MGSNVLIIGASRGIGLELVRQQRAAGARVVATARDDAGLARLGKCKSLESLSLSYSLVHGGGLRNLAGLAALLKDPARYAGQRVGLVLCGGNIDPLLLSAIIERGMVRAGRLARIRVGARDAPGVLARITAIVAEAGANIDEVHHQRAFSALSVQNVEVVLVLKTRNPAHVREVLAALAAAGFEAQSA